MFEHFTPHLSQYVAHGALALFGAIVHAAKAYHDGTSRNLVDFCALVLMSSFSGVMFALLGLAYFGEDSYLTLALAGTGGYVGVEGMSLVISFFAKRFKYDQPTK